MSQLRISAANSTNIHTVSTRNGIPFALGDVCFVDPEDFVCRFFMCLQGKNTTFIQHPTQ